MYKQTTIYGYVYHRLLTDISRMLGKPLGFPDDLDAWVFNEGPLLDKALLQWLEGAGPEPCIPEWLSPLWEHARMRYPHHLALLRQCLVFCYKIEHEPTHEQILHSESMFVATDTALSVWRTAWLQYGKNRVDCAVARNYIGRVIARCNWEAITGSHGPGAVFPPRKPSDKSRFTTIYSSIQSHYPADRYFVPHGFAMEALYDRQDELLESDTIVANLCCVPKDRRGPRLICVHPAEAIWVQQGQRLILEHAIEHSPLTRGYINFTDQSVNGRLALKSSYDREFATLDLSEASDCLSCDLVKFLLGDFTYDKLSCARATHARLSDGSEIVLNKWAPMGNALCFPVQSLIYWALVRASIWTRHQVNADVYVFGDDILFPSRYYDCVAETLTCVGLKINTNKTFRRGSFRESCGVDAYNGFDITPLRARRAGIITMSDVTSWLSLAHRLRLRGYEETASSIYTAVRRRWGYLPLCNNLDADGWFEYVARDLAWIIRYEPRLKFRASTHTWSVPARRVRSVQTRPPQDDWYHLMDSLLLIEKGTTRCLEYPVPYTERLTYGWLDCRYNP